MASILIADDSPSMRKLVSAALCQAGHDVIEAPDGDVALEFARDNPVDLVITDLNMPNMDGITLVAELRDLGPMKGTPILLLTTEISCEKKRAAKNAGATGWLNKPFDPDQMLATIDRLLS